MKYLPLILLTACGLPEKPIPINSPYKFTEVVDLGGGVNRMENIEVVCYRLLEGYGGGLSCKWKDK
jgi:hypothetical protein